MASAASSISHLAPVGNLSRYLQTIQKFPMLEPDEEHMLAKRWRDDADVEAAHLLVTSHLRLVVKIASGYRGYGLPFGELISEGNVGIMHAVKRFDPDRDCRFATYAKWWIKSSVRGYSMHSWSLVKIGTTVAQKKLFFGLRQMKARIEAIEDRELSPENVATIAERMNVPEDDVISMNGRLMARDHSLNTPIGPEGGEEWQSLLVDESCSQEKLFAENEELTMRWALLHAALDRLNERERRILTDRFLNDPPSTLARLGRQYDISRERVRQIEARALEKIRESIKSAVLERRFDG